MAPHLPNATYALPQGELDFFATPAADSRRMVFDDSVAPVIAAGQALPSAAMAASIGMACASIPRPAIAPAIWRSR